MKLLPWSLFGRLLAVAIAAILAALAFAAVTIGHVLERFVMHGLDERLDGQIALLATAVRPDGAVDPGRLVSPTPFDRPGSEWVWQVTGPNGEWRSASLGDGRIAAPPIPPPPHGAQRPDPDRPRPGETIAPDGQPLHDRFLVIATPRGPVTLVAAAPRRLVARPLREAMAPLLLSLALLGAGLLLAIFIQLRIGLRPVARLREALALVRAGSMRRVPIDQPTELRGLAAELNALLDKNEAGLAHARRHVANLAHGLKTPLAGLGVALAEPGRDPDGSLRESVRRIDGRIRHHLGRARAAAPAGGGRPRTPLAPTVADLVATLRRIHADRPVAAAIEVPVELAAAVDAQDLDEMIGNLLDNGWRHASQAVAVRAARDGSRVRIAIDDDGPGLGEADQLDALLPGRRLDERDGGHGFGLPIARELAELYGGALTLGLAELGGLRAELMLPAG